MTREQRTVFDEVAQVYDRARPEYPARLFEDVFDSARLAPGDRILEIGAGTGKATRGFAGRGFPMLCIEPGERMAEVLRASLPPAADVRVEKTRFEDWPVEPGGFGLVVAGQSFHWVDPAVALVRASTALRRGGTLALFANRPARGESALHREIEACYLEHASALRAGALRSYDARSYPDEIRASEGLGTPFEAEYPFHVRYDVDAYLDLLSTQSDHRLLDPADRAALFAAIREAIAAGGGSLRVDYRSVLVLARRQ